jgi:hypothetical protein
MLRILRRFCVCLLALLPAAAGAQTFPALAPLPGTGTLATPADPTSFSFVVAGDNRPAKSGDPQPATLTAIVHAIQGIKPGGAGAPLTKKATPATGGYHNYLLVQVKGAEVTVTVNELP